MDSAQTNLSIRHYAVFLSYRHADNKEPGRQWATWLHHLLEGYEIPEDLVGTKNSKGDLIPESLYPVFRDEEELPADADLTKNIRLALENSDLLVVLCSPRAVESRFVADEIRYFKELGKSHRILALIIDGEPNAADDPGKAKRGIAPDSECLPEPLRYGVAGDDAKIDWSRRTEPIAADVRPEGNAEQGWTTGAAYREDLQKSGKLRAKEIAQKVLGYEQRLELAKLKVVAGSLGVPLGVLTQRDRAMQLRKARERTRALRRWLLAVGILAVCAISAGILALMKAKAEREQRELVQQAEVAAHQSASAADFSVADLEMKRGDAAGALPYLADALRQNPANQAATALTVAILRDDPLLPITIQHDAPVDWATFSADSRYVLTTSGSVARVWATHSGDAVGSPMRTASAIGQATFVSNSNATVALQEAASQVWSAQMWDLGTGKTAGPQTRADNPAFSETLSRDGKWALIISTQGAQLWDVAAGKRVGQPIGPAVPANTSSQYSGSIGPNAKRIAIGVDSVVQVWDVATAKAIGKPIELSDNAHNIQFSADGKRLLVVFGDDSDTLQVFDAATGASIGTPISYYDLIQLAGFSPSGRQVVTMLGGQYERGASSWKVQAQIWDVQTGKALGKPVEHDGMINSVAFSPDGRWLLTASDDKTARLWNARTGDLVGFPMQHADKVNSAEFSPDGNFIVTASADDTARIWPMQTGRAVGEAIRFDKSVRFGNFSPDGARLVTGSSGDTAGIWDVATGKLILHSTAFANRVDSAVFSPDGTRVLSVSAEKEAQVWDAQSGAFIGEAMHHKSAITVAAFSPDGSRVLTASQDGTAQLWDAATGKPAAAVMRCGEWIYFAAFSADGKKIVASCGDGSIRVWDAQTAQLIGKPIHFTDYPDSPGAVSFSPDGAWILAVSNNQAARMWDAATGAPIGGAIRSGDPIQAASFTPDGNGLLISSGSVAQIWDARTGKPLSEPMQHEKPVDQATFSRDGNWVMTIAHDGTARVWDARTGRAVSRPLGFGNEAMLTEVMPASFSPDARWAFTDFLSDRAAVVWDAATTAAQAPPWLPDLAEAVSGMELSPRGALEPSERDTNALRQTLQNLAGGDDLSRFGRWFAADPTQRAISPRSPVLVPDFISDRLKENNAASAEDAYRMDPADPVALASLAKFEKDKDTASLLFQLALERAQLLASPGKIAQIKSIGAPISANAPQSITKPHPP